jgi:hypothetical protein
VKIQLKRSNVLEGGAAKEPTAEQMEYGELAVNYNTSDPVLFIKDSSNQIIRLTNRDTIPPGLPDINNPDYQPGTLDDRYVPLGSWAEIPALT